MRKINFLVIISATIFFSHDAAAKSIVDTSGIIHKTDGLGDEWPAAKFALHKETGIEYAIDNNSEDLYLALRITSYAEQLNLMSRGMKMFIDLKGKHKESRGVEFPIAKETEITPPIAKENTQIERSDWQKQRILLFRNMLTLKLFGFGEEGLEQNLGTANNVQIAFNWDSTETMHIEYKVPLKMLETAIAPLNQKLISIGWKVNKIDTRTIRVEGPVMVTTRTVGVPAGSSPPGTTRPPGSTTSPATTKDQYIWTKYTFTF